jgi:hypothetical protein
MTDLRPRRFHALAYVPGGWAAICEEKRAWTRAFDSTTWTEQPPLPEIENYFADDAGFNPGTEELRALADFMAQTGATPLFDGFDGPPAPPRPEVSPAPAEPELLTYDEPSEDPLL